MRYIKQSINTIVQKKVAQVIEDYNIEKKIDEEFNRKIEDYRIIIDDTVKQAKQEKKL